MVTGMEVRVGSAPRPAISAAAGLRDTAEWRSRNIRLLAGTTAVRTARKLPQMRPATSIAMSKHARPATKADGKTTSPLSLATARPRGCCRR